MKIPSWKLAPRLRFPVLNLLGWAAYGSAAFLLYFPYQLSDTARVILFYWPYFIACLCSMLLYGYFRRIGITSLNLKSLTMRALAGAAAAAHLWIVIDLLMMALILKTDVSAPGWFKVYISSLLQRSIPMMAWTVIYLGTALWADWKRLEEKARHANELAQSAQLQMLRCQLNPHFLFNALNSIRALIDENEAVAADMITELSEFLRYSLQSRDYQGVPLKDEMEAVRHYFAIQKKRYENKLDLYLDISPAAESFPVLSFLIHPLVENAVKYGMKTSPMPLKIQVLGKVEERKLVIEIRNSGRWIEPETGKNRISVGTGTGLDNVRRRLENAYARGHSLDIIKGDREVCVRMILEKQQHDHEF